MIAPPSLKTHQTGDLEAGAGNGCPFRRYGYGWPDRCRKAQSRLSPRPEDKGCAPPIPFFLELFAGVSEAAREHGCDFLVEPTPPRPPRAKTRCRTSRARWRDFFWEAKHAATLNTTASPKPMPRFVVWGAQYCRIRPIARWARTNLLSAAAARPALGALGAQTHRFSWRHRSAEGRAAPSRLSRRDGATQNTHRS